MHQRNVALRLRREAKATLPLPLARKERAGLRRDIVPLTAFRAACRIDHGRLTRDDTEQTSKIFGQLEPSSLVDPQTLEQRRRTLGRRASLPSFQFPGRPVQQL